MNIFFIDIDKVVKVCYLRFLKRLINRKYNKNIFLYGCYIGYYIKV